MPEGKYWNLAGQTVAIVASILLAFGIQAWWEERQQKADERVVLESLLVDLIQKKAIFDRDRNYNETILQASSKLLVAATGDGEELTENDVDILINGFIYGNQESGWDSAPLNSIFVGGNISVVSNQQLIQELSSLYVSFNRLKLFYGYDHDFMLDYVTPFILDNVNQTQLTGISEKLPGTEINYAFPVLKISNRYKHSELLSSVKFQNLLIGRIYSLLDITNFAWLGFEEQLDGVIKLVEVELAE